MAYAKRAYCEHVAIRVKDLDWHVRFFREVLGMDLRDGSQAPRQVWTVGGVQLIADPHFEGPEGRLAHLGIMVEDLGAALAEARGWGVAELLQGPNWLALPGGLSLELMQATGTAVADALAIDPRA